MRLLFLIFFATATAALAQLDRGSISGMVQQAPRTVLHTRLGNSTRRDPEARSPWFLNGNVTVAKELRVRERVGITIRGEAFNLFNHVRWGGPSSQQMQLAPKVLF